MAQVLVPRSRAEGGFGSQPVSRSSSPTPLFMPNYEKVSPSSIPYSSSRIALEPRNLASMPSSAPSSPRPNHHDSSSQTSLLSTPTSSLSLDDYYCGTEEEYDDEDIHFPSLPTNIVFSDVEPPPSPLEGDSEGNEPLEENGNSQRHPESQHESTDSPAPPDIMYQSVGDDTALTNQPSRHVDYLSHEWCEEDIWCSWRHIVSRRNQLENTQRLENASWRTWAKFRGSLKTVSPERLNWMKDHDVTWLYGPLQTSRPQNVYLDSPACRTSTHRTPSFLSRKPILKKRSVSEVMLRRSLSNSTLVRQAVNALTIQNILKREARRPKLATRVASDHGPGFLEQYKTRTTVPTPFTRSLTATFPMNSPPVGERHIHFNNKVEQCIAINKDTDDNEEFDPRSGYDTLENESDDGMITMRMETSKERKLSHLKSVPKGFQSTETSHNKTIAMLPSTTLKCRGDTPEPAEQMKEQYWATPHKLTHTSSSETLRPAKPSSNFLLDDEDDEGGVEWQSPQTIGTSQRGFARGGIAIGFDSDDEGDIESRGLRRTPSGMFMPYEGDEEDDSTGIFGRVIDTVNTARDIAHVIWNVGWKR